MAHWAVWYDKGGEEESEETREVPAEMRGGEKEKAKK